MSASTKPKSGTRVVLFSGRSLRDVVRKDLFCFSNSSKYLCNVNVLVASFSDLSKTTFIFLIIPPFSFLNSKITLTVI